jgi:crossover junction endodeoxyribonuclease RuvC
MSFGEMIRSETVQRILGIDPGTRSMGYGLIETKGSRTTRAVAYGALRPGMKKPLYQRLGIIAQDLEIIIRKHEPHVLVLEQSFCGKSARTAIAIGEARGIVLSLAGRYELILEQYTATSVKSAIVGAGRAGKEQVQKMVQMILGLKEDFETDDESDALALALAYVQRSSYVQLHQRATRQQRS